MDYFYDGQIRRYLVQFIRAFADIKIQSGVADEGTLVQTRVPVVYGDPSWMGAQILKGGSENTLMPSPMMAAWIVNLDPAPERRRDPAFESQVNAIERNFEDGEYGTEVGNRYTVNRYMPVPYNLTMQLDIWTTTTTTKLQILEQITTIFNPSVQLQQNSNKFDWTALFELELTNIQWSNRGIPQGTEQDRDVASLQFNVPIWINPPAKVRRIKIIEQIVTNIFEASQLPDEEIDKNILDPMSCIGTQIDQLIVTPGDYKIGVGTDGLASNEIILLNKYGSPDPLLSWVQLFEAYGNIEDFETILRLKLDPDIESSEQDIMGTVTTDPARPNILTYNIDVDTLPSTLPGGPVDDIIDPQLQLPGKELPIAIAGQRYLLVGHMTDGEEPATPLAPNSPWGLVNAYENDIIEYNGTDWIVVFDSRAESKNQYVINLRTMNHYKFDGNNWVFTYLGEYFPGYWRMENINGGSSGVDPVNPSPSDLC